MVAEAGAVGAIVRAVEINAVAKNARLRVGDVFVAGEKGVGRLRERGEAERAEQGGESAGGTGKGAETGAEVRLRGVHESVGRRSKNVGERE